MNQEIKNNYIVKIIQTIINYISKEIFNKYGEETSIKFLDRFENFLNNEEVIKKIFENLQKNNYSPEILKEELIKYMSDLIPDFEEIFNNSIKKYEELILEFINKRKE
ncbi:MAG: hypothetical protein NZ822_03065 [Patescibacteria group bacterium]|nr:hypothetical protein [Patescibacteria group bacterium]